MLDQYKPCAKLAVIKQRYNALNVMALLLILGHVTISCTKFSNNLISTFCTVFDQRLTLPVS